MIERINEIQQSHQQEVFLLRSRITSLEEYISEKSNAQPNSAR